MCANVGRRRRAGGGLRRGSRRLGCRGGRARNDGSRRLGEATALAGVVVPTIALGTLAVLACRAAVLLNIAAPLAKVEALESIGESSLDEARSSASYASSVGLQAILLITPIRQRREAPLATLVLASGRSGDGGRTHGAGGRGAGALGSGRAGSRGGRRGRGGTRGGRGRRRITRGGRRRGRITRGGRRRRRSRGAGRSVAAGLQGLQIRGNVQVQEASSATCFRRVSVASKIALRIINLCSIIRKDIAAPALASKLSSGQREAFFLAGSQAALSGEGGGIDISGPGKGTSQLRIISEATRSLVVADGDVLGGECWVLPDREDIVSSTCFRLVAVARKSTLRVINLRTIYSVAAEADAIILEASITEAIA